MHISKDRYGGPATGNPNEMTVMDSLDLQLGLGGMNASNRNKQEKVAVNLDDTDMDLNFAIESMKKKSNGGE